MWDILLLECNRLDPDHSPIQTSEVYSEIRIPSNENPDHLQSSCCFIAPLDIISTFQILKKIQYYCTAWCPASTKRVTDDYHPALISTVSVYLQTHLLQIISRITQRNSNTYIVKFYNSHRNAVVRHYDHLHFGYLLGFIFNKGNLWTKKKKLCSYVVIIVTDNIKKYIIL